MLYAGSSHCLSYAGSSQWSRMRAAPHHDDDSSNEKGNDNNNDYDKYSDKYNDNDIDNDLCD